MKNAPTHEAPVYLWAVLLAVLVEHENGGHPHPQNTTRVAVAAYDFARTQAAINVGTVGRALDRLADLLFVESCVVEGSRGAAIERTWALTDAGRERYRELADLFAHLAAVTPRKHPKHAPRKGPRK